jgi:hypothetical protein
MMLSMKQRKKEEGTWWANRQVNGVGFTKRRRTESRCNAAVTHFTEAVAKA